MLLNYVSETLSLFFLSLFLLVYTPIQLIQLNFDMAIILFIIG